MRTNNASLAGPIAIRFTPAAQRASAERERAASDVAMQQNTFPDLAVNCPVASCPPGPIQIKTLGGFALTIAGVPIQFGRKVQKKPLELLKALVASGGARISCEKLSEALWPDADGDLAVRALATALYRLRKLLGPHCLVRHDGTLCLDQRVCDVDVWRLERLLTDIERHSRTRDYTSVAAGIEKLLADYHGTFLPQHGDLPWVLSARERYRSRMLRAVDAAGDCMSRAQCFDLAVACYEYGIDIDPLNETMYGGLMATQLAQQRFSEVIRTYDRCRRALRTQLAMSPSPGVEVLYRRARAGASADEPAHPILGLRSPRSHDHPAQSVSNL